MEKYNQQGMDSMKAQTARAARIKARSATIKTKRESKKTHRQSSDKNRNQAKNRKSGADTQTKSNAQMFHSSKVSNQEQSKALSTSASSHRNITIASKTSNNNGSGSDNKENHSSNRLSSTSKSKLRTGSSVDKNGLRSSTNRNCNSSDGKSKRTKSLSHSASGSHISRSRHSLGNLSLNPLKTSGESGSGRVSSKEKKSYVKPSSSSNIKRRGLGQSNSRASLSSSSSKVDVLKFPVSRAGLLDDQLSSRRASKGNGSLNSKSRLPGQSVKPKGHDDPSKNTYFASAGSNLKLGITDPKQMSASTNNKVMEDYILHEKRRRVSRSQSSASLRSSRRGSSTSTSVSSTPSKKVGTNSGPKAGKSKKKGPSEALLKRLTNKTYTKASSSSSTSFASSSASSSASAVTSSKPKKLASSASVSVLMSGGKIQRNMSLSKEHTEVAQHRADFYERLLKK